MGLLDNLNFSQPFSLSSLLPSEAQLQAYKQKSDAEALAQFGQDPNPVRRVPFNLLTALGVNPTLAKAAPTTADVLPVTGDISALADAKTAFGKGNYVTGGLLSMAALPFVPSIVGKGKGLLKQTDERKSLFDNAARIDKFKEQGFNTDLMLYHGSSQPLKEIKGDRGLYLTPDPNYAENYTNPNYSAMVKSEGMFSQPPSPNITPVFIKTNELFDTRIPEHRKIFEDKFFGKYGNQTGLQENGLPDWTDGEEFKEFFEQENLPFKGVILDEGGFLNEAGEVVKRPISYAVFEPQSVKSIFDN